MQIENVARVVSLVVAMVALICVLLWEQLGFPGVQPWMCPMLVLLLMAGIGVAAVMLA